MELGSEGEIMKEQIKGLRGKWVNEEEEKQREGNKDYHYKAFPLGKTSSGKEKFSCG